MRFALLAFALVACGSPEPVQPPVETDTGVDAPAVVDAPEVAVPFDGGAKDRPAPEDRPDVPPAADRPTVTDNPGADVADVAPDPPDVLPAEAGCAGGTTDCDGNPANGCETNTASDWRACGMCRRVCPGDFARAVPTCEASRCVLRCAAGWGDCFGHDACDTDLNTNRFHCGRCGNACVGSRVCVGGACR